MIAKKLSGEASEEEIRELEKLLRSNPELHYSMQTITDLWHSKLLQNISKEDPNKAFEKHLERLESVDESFLVRKEEIIPELPKKNRRKILLVCLSAAIAVSIFFAGVKIYNGSVSDQSAASKINSEVSTRYGSKTNLVLPDGTKVWLNAGSKLNYDKNYGNSIREVGLTGEAYFDVVKNPEKPFIIHTSKIDIKVLGTAFNVKSYPGEKTIETSLIRGSIEITFKDRPSEKVILKPNEKLVVANDDAPVVVQKRQSFKQSNEPIVAISHLSYARRDSTIIETAWVQNKLFFQDESFRELAAKMQRWYGVSIQFDNSERDTLHFTGSFENETIQQALDALQLTARFNYDIQGNQVSIFK
ncbi:MAG: FecR family protein [Bacteroidetes bacterium]|nr:FecR family protein [Bacteroidota bacterium]